MANPVLVPCPAGAWTKVIDGQTNGSIIMKFNIAIYSITTRDAGDAAPTLPNEGRSAFAKCATEFLTDTASRDVYIYCHNVAGSVEVTV